MHYAKIVFRPGDWRPPLADHVGLVVLGEKRKRTLRGTTTFHSPTRVEGDADEESTGRRYEVREYEGTGWNGLERQASQKIPGPEVAD